MNSKSLTMLVRTASALAVLVPAAACAQPADQATPATHKGATTTKSISAATFVAKHEKKLLAGDTDGDGKISRAEFLATAKAGKHDPAKRFAKLDANGDGMLDRAEIEAMLNRRFKRLDTDGDGQLSADERGAAHLRKASHTSDGAKS